MRAFLTAILTLQCLASLMTMHETFSYANLAKVSTTPALLAFLSSFLLYLIALCMMFGGVSQAEDGATPTEPKPDNAHGGWWNLGRADMLLMAVLLLEVCAYGISFSQLSYYASPHSFFRPAISLHELPGILLQDMGIWLGATLLMFLLSLFVRFCHGGKPGSRRAATLTAIVSVVGMLFIAAAVHASSKGASFLSSPGSVYVLASMICCYKAVRCVSLRCLLPEWAGGWHEGGCPVEPAEAPAASAPAEQQPASDVAEDAPAEQQPASNVAEDTPPADPTPAPTCWGKLPQPSTLHHPAPPRLQVAAPPRLTTPVTPQEPAPPHPARTDKHVRYTILALLAVICGIFMAHWSDDSLRGISSGEARTFGTLFGISFLFFGNFVYDATKKAIREYRAERAEKALPYALLVVIALGLWFALFCGLAALMR